MSAFPRRTDFAERERHFRKVPTAEVPRRWSALRRLQVPDLAGARTESAVRSLLRGNVAMANALVVHKDRLPQSKKLLHAAQYPCSTLQRDVREASMRQASLRSDRAVAHGSEGAFNGIGRPQVFPVLGREVVERQFGGGLGFGHPDFLQRAFGLRLLALRQLGEHVGGLVHPAALLARFRPDLTGGGLPEPERAVGDGEPRRHVEPAPLQVEQQIAPLLRALAGAIGAADQ